MLKLSDLPVDEADSGQDAQSFFETLADDGEAENVILILGQLDPLETANGEPRWTAEQIGLIEQARDVLKSWESSDDEDDDSESDDESDSDADEDAESGDTSTDDKDDEGGVLVTSAV